MFSPLSLCGARLEHYWSAVLIERTVGFDSFYTALMVLADFIPKITNDNRFSLPSPLIRLAICHHCLKQPARHDNNVIQYNTHKQAVYLNREPPTENPTHLARRRSRACSERLQPGVPEGSRVQALCRVRSRQRQYLLPPRQDRTIVTIVTFMTRILFGVLVMAEI